MLAYCSNNEKGNGRHQRILWQLVARAKIMAALMAGRQKQDQTCRFSASIARKTTRVISVIALDQE